jgi:hypothetical protein
MRPMQYGMITSQHCTDIVAHRRLPSSVAALAAVAHANSMDVLCTTLVLPCMRYGHKSHKRCAVGVSRGQSLAAGMQGGHCLPHGH